MKRPKTLCAICRPCVLLLNCSFTVANKPERLVCVKCGKFEDISTFVRWEELSQASVAEVNPLVQPDLGM